MRDVALDRSETLAEIQAIYISKRNRLEEGQLHKMGKDLILFLYSKKGD